MRRGDDRGHLMVGLMVAVAILVILSTVALQAWEDMNRRELEAEMIFRAQDICRALRRYRQDHGGQLPLEWKQLGEPGTKGQYYIRKLWTDPLVKDGKWGFLYATPGGGVLDPNAPVETSLVPGEEPKSEPKSAFGPSKLNPGEGGGAAQGEGGLPIAGVKSLCAKKPFRVLNDESDYAKWQFTVFDLDTPGGGFQIGGGKGPGGRVGQTGPVSPTGPAGLTPTGRSGQAGQGFPARPGQRRSGGGL